MRRVVVDIKEIEKHKCGPRPQRTGLCPRSKSVATEVIAWLAGWDESVSGDLKTRIFTERGKRNEVWARAGDSSKEQQSFIFFLRESQGPLHQSHGRPATG